MPRKTSSKAGSKKRAASSASSSKRRTSKRVKKIPQKFRPGGDANIPFGFEVMIHDLATAAAEKADLPVSPEAIEEMKTALGPALEMFCDAVWANALAKGRDVPTDKDFDAVMKAYRGASKKRK